MEDYNETLIAVATIINAVKTKKGLTDEYLSDVQARIRVICAETGIVKEALSKYSNPDHWGRFDCWGRRIFIYKHVSDWKDTDSDSPEDFGFKIAQDAICAVNDGSEFNGAFLSFESDELVVLKKAVAAYLNVKKAEDEPIGMIEHIHKKVFDAGRMVEVMK